MKAKTQDHGEQYKSDGPIQWFMDKWENFDSSDPVRDCELMQQWTEDTCWTYAQPWLQQSGSADLWNSLLPTRTKTRTG